MDPHAKRAVIMHIASSGLLHYPALFSDGIGLVARSGPPPEPRRAHTPLLKTRNRLYAIGTAQGRALACSGTLMPEQCR
jgi:hypothetical protein